MTFGRASLQSSNSFELSREQTLAFHNGAQREEKNTADKLKYKKVFQTEYKEKINQH